MALVGQRVCDICRGEISGNDFVVMILDDMRLTTEPKHDEICLICYDKIRSYIRNGLDGKPNRPTQGLFQVSHPIRN